MKCWLIETEAPFCGTTQHYAAYSDEDPTDWLYEHWFDEECQNLWDSYSFYNQDEWEAEWDEMSDDEKEVMYNGDFDDFMDAKYDEWCADCSLIAKEIDEEELDDYVPEGEGHLEVIYDKRNEK